MELVELIDFFTKHTQETGKEQATMVELLEAGFTGRALLKATRDGKLRRGTTGYWLPKASDPGFVAVVIGKRLRGRKSQPAFHEHCVICQNEEHDPEERPHVFEGQE